MAKTKKNETTSSELANIEERPSFIDVADQGEGVGLEGVRAQDLIIPRAKLLQALSPEVDEGNNVSGQIIDSVTGEILADEENSIAFIPVFHFLQWIEWGERESNEGIIDQSLDPKGSLAMSVARREKKETKEGREVFRVTEYHNFLVLLPELSMKFPRIISCSKTNHRRARQLLALMRMREGCPIYAGKYNLLTEKTENQNGQKYYVIDFENNGWTTEDEYDHSKEAHEYYKKAHDEQRIAVQQDSDEVVNETEI